MNTQRVEGHTQLPWQLDYLEGAHWNVDAADGTAIALVQEHRSPAVRRANAAFIVHACNNIERLEKVNEALVTELMAANAQMESAAECIEKGRYDEALLHVRSMSGKRAEVIRLAEEPA